MDFKVTSREHLDHVDLHVEEQTLSDGSKVHNVTIRTLRGGRIRFCMTDEKAASDFAHEMVDLLDRMYGTKIGAVEIDAEGM